MTIFKNIRLGLLHVAVTITLVPITGMLNRIMIHEFGLLASVVAFLVVLPSLLSPLQVWVGQYSDAHPRFGYRRTPYIVAGVFLCVIGAVLAPHVALLMASKFGIGILVGALVFGIWGLGFNIAVVSYLSLASDLATDENQRSRTIAVMWFMMITSVILTAILSGNAVEPYSDAKLFLVFRLVGIISIVVAALGLIGLEPRYNAVELEQRTSNRASIQAVINNPHARLFFVYLILLLAAILGQDVLLEPFGAQAFAMSVKETTQLTATWGSMTLLALVLQGFVFNRWLSNKQGAALGGVIAFIGLVTIAVSGILHVEALFVPGVATLGFGTGIATSTNLALMLGMTTPEQVGLFIGAWGVADAMARGVGNLLGGVVRDVIAYSTGSASGAYVSVFLIEAVMLGFSLILLHRINVKAFHSHQQPSLTQIVAIAGDA